MPLIYKYNGSYTDKLNKKEESLMVEIIKNTNGGRLLTFRSCKGREDLDAKVGPVHSPECAK